MNKIIVQKLLEIHAVFFDFKNLFTWASGIKSPIYCDNRLSLSYPAVRDLIKIELTNLIRNHYKSVEVIAGTSTAGIPHAALVADMMNLPMIYVRFSKKEHGRRHLIEGKIKKGQNVVVVEDLISTATSALEVVKILKKENTNILGIASIFSYDTTVAKKKLTMENVKNFSLANLDILIEVALEKNIINKDNKMKILEFRNSF
ncbi:MAG: orotate phosphoribosyltransferase [Oscillospiraceae bacterium]|jgi:orotate phosphoribosyltransferase|nr:orotate phosphoribosyltransferase [Oscillospiraceae bacterium]